MPGRRQNEGEGVLVIVTGGNICLYARDEAGARSLSSADPNDLKKYVLGDQNRDSLELFEGGSGSTELFVKFLDIRKRDKDVADPEEQDSAQVKPELWTRLAEIVVENYLQYEGFVILHGLDTMAYTASAVSFMLRDLGKPVVLTGSQRPLNYPRTDALQNIISSITFAGARTLGIEPVITEVMVYSYDRLHRGNRVTMVSASSYNAFDSPNFAPLASMGADTVIQPHLVRQNPNEKRPNLQKYATARVQILDVFPGLEASILRSILESNEQIERANTTQENEEAPDTEDALGQAVVDERRPTRGVVFRTYGLGTAPTGIKFLAALAELEASGVVVVNVTQARSSVPSYGVDPVSLRLFEQGVVSGIDMTAEAAYAKLMTLLSMNKDPQEVADLIQIDICGEQGQSVFNFHFDAGCTDEEDGRYYVKHLNVSRAVVSRHVVAHKDTVIRFIQLRVLGITPYPCPEAPQNDDIEFNAYLESRSKKGMGTPIKLKHMLRWQKGGRATVNVAFNITHAKADVLSENTILKISTFRPIRWKRAAIVVYADPPRL